ncbi:MULTISPECIES: RHS repeat-associated core domain-containing protein [Marinobacter]|uniref:RHS repeat-associated core domain-containing protein n=1 Tax=uncultured Marinobacter sp. TaxID=187379 RepID=UPI001D1102F3|nr:MULTISPECIES: RHS repeat-associated core domain-containing protein [Marinobacter]MDM8180046.1 RHS repeat-associated core domain-containing protein [Marinobacter salarius]
MHSNRHRYYNPNIVGFLTPGPIGLAGGLNNYQYVPNPTGWVDPLEQEIKCSFQVTKLLLRILREIQRFFTLKMSLSGKGW